MREHPVGIRQAEGLLPRGGLIGRAVRIAELAGGGNTDQSFRRSVPDGPEGKPMRQHEVFPARNEFRKQKPLPGRMDPVGVSKLEHDLRLVERDKMRNTAGKMRRHHAREPRKAFRRPAILPAAGFLQRLRQLPVIERHPRRDAVCKAAVYHAVIVLEPGLVPPAVSVRVDARPARGKAVRTQPERR